MACDILDAITVIGRIKFVKLIWFSSTAKAIVITTSSLLEFTVREVSEELSVVISDFFTALSHDASEKIINIAVDNKSCFFILHHSFQSESI